MVSPEGEKPKARNRRPAGRDPGAVLGGGVAVPGDLLARDGVEEPVTVVRDDHDQVMAALGMRRETDAEQSTDSKGPCQQRIHTTELRRSRSAPVEPHRRLRSQTPGTGL